MSETTFSPALIEQVSTYVFGGYGWETRLAEVIGRSARQVRYYVTGYSIMPPSIATILAVESSRRFNREIHSARSRYQALCDAVDSFRLRQIMLAQPLLGEDNRYIDEVLRAHGLKPLARETYQVSARIRDRLERAHKEEFGRLPAPKPGDAPEELLGGLG